MFHGNIDQFGKSLPGIQLCLRSDLRKQTRKRKDKKSIQRCQIDRLAKGYKRAIDKIRGPIAKNGPKTGNFGQNFGQKFFLTKIRFGHCR